MKADYNKENLENIRKNIKVITDKDFNDIFLKISKTFSEIISYIEYEKRDVEAVSVKLSGKIEDLVNKINKVINRIKFLDHSIKGLGGPIVQETVINVGGRPTVITEVVDPNRGLRDNFTKEKTELSKKLDMLQDAKDICEEAQKKCYTYIMDVNSFISNSEDKKAIFSDIKMFIASYGNNLQIAAEDAKKYLNDYSLVCPVFKGDKIIRHTKNPVGRVDVDGVEGYSSTLKKYSGLLSKEIETMICFNKQERDWHDINEEKVDIILVKTSSIINDLKNNINENIMRLNKQVGYIKDYLKSTKRIR